MRHTIKSLEGFTMGATDGEIGKVVEFYFDDETWTIRYLVVKTGGWLSDRKVLISPTAIQGIDWENNSFPVNLSKDQIKNSPDIDTEQTVSRQQEIELYNHYDWPYYGNPGVGFYGGLGMSGMIDSRVPLEDAVAERNFDKQTSDPHLRGTDEVKGYKIRAVDGDIGDVEDFIIDETNWNIRYLVVDTGNWFPGKKVILSPSWIREVRWEDSSVHVNMAVDTIKNSPEYDPSVPVEEKYQNELSDYYQRPY